MQNSNLSRIKLFRFRSCWGKVSKIGAVLLRTNCEMVVTTIIAVYIQCSRQNFNQPHGIVLNTLKNRFYSQKDNKLL